MDTETTTLRDTEFYKNMSFYTACAFTEGFCEGEEATEEEQLIAWQYIWDNGLWRQLQGWYGRTVHNLVENGRIER